MRRLFLFLAVPVLIAGYQGIRVAAAEPTSRGSSWQKVREAVARGLPQTAIEHLNPVIDAALKDKAHAEAIRAIGQRIALEGEIQGGRPEEKIVRLQAEIAKAPAEMKPVMEAILANWYWHFFQQNRMRFLHRTATAEPVGEDFTTWDLRRLFAEIDQHFSAALSAERLLRDTPVTEYDTLLERGSMPDRYRPTLYDFLAANALEFYLSGEQAGSRAENAFELSAAGPIFDATEDFTAWQVETPEAAAPLYKAVRLYQGLLNHHRTAQNHEAMMDWDLDRLRFGYNHAFGEEKDARYKAALERFVEQWGDHEISARARHAWATVLHGEGELLEAHKLAEQGWRAFPESPGGGLCYNLMQQIEARSATISTERVWNQPWSAIEVRYRNVAKVYFRLVAWDFEKGLASPSLRHPDYLDDADRRAVLSANPALQWNADLPPTDDFQQRVEKLAAPDDVKPGYYYLVASHDPAFRDVDNVVSYAALWVSDLALVVRSRSGDAILEGLVLHAASGEPIEGAEVRAWAQDYRARQYHALAPVKSDKNGLFRFEAKHQQNHILVARHGNQRLGAAGAYSAYRHDRTIRPFERTVFFTDRSIYRPGQTVHFKGITIAVDQNRDGYRVIADRSMTVLFVDVNGKEIERRSVKTNDYGSFSGSFTAPRDRLMGRMSIRVDGGPGGQAVVAVEEYKRPTFQVAIDAPKTAPRLDEPVYLVGTATAYTGAPADGAQVRWRVVRRVRFPSWWYGRYWWMPPMQQEGQEIARGTAPTDTAGRFSLEFVARPDRSVAEKDEPTFQFEVHADVTDSAGETRSTRRVINVGYTALAASLSASSWLAEDRPSEVTIRATTLDGEGQQAEGSLKIHRLQSPEEVHRMPLPAHHGTPVARRGRMQGEEPAPDPSNPSTWPLGEVVAERGFTTDLAGNASYSFELAAGLYRAVLETQDRFGKKVAAELPLRVLAPEAGKLPLKIPHLFDAPDWSAKPGDDFTALWGSGYENARAYVEVEHRGRLLQNYWTDEGRTQTSITQKVTEAMRGGFTVRVTMVRENRAYMEQRQVTVPWSNKDLTVTWERFVSKLAPAQKETWTAVVTGPDAKKTVAEMVATLYDQSLDAFLPHHWPGSFDVFRQDASPLRSNFENAAVHLRHILGHWEVDARPVQISYRTFPHELIGQAWTPIMLGGRGGARMRTMESAGALPPAPGMAMMKAAAPMMDGANRNSLEAAAPAEVAALGEDKAVGAGDLESAPPPAVGLEQVAARTNLNETAFFFPHVVSNSDGEVRLEFTMPQALTQWRFLGFAHDADLRAGLLADSVVTAKDLMVQPNPPRFLREGDVLEFTVRVTNQSAARQTGTVRLTFANARTGASVDAALANTQTDQAFDVPAKESRTYAWRLAVPNASGVVVYRAVGSTGRLSDGEEGYLPILSRRILVTESLPLPVRGPATRRFEFEKLLAAAESDTLESKTLTVQMVSNPSWCAVMALPYLMEYPHQCSEQTFNRLYANALARHIAHSDARIRRVFDQWKGEPALDSPLEKNEDIKAVMLEETPWVRQAEAESQARRNVGILFDDNRLNEETRRLLAKLGEQQLAEGAWPWFPGGPPNDYITLYITTGFGRMRHLGVDMGVDPAIKSLGRLDAWIDKIYRRILEHGNMDHNNLSPTIALYLYGRSFFLEDRPIDAQHGEALSYFLGQAKKHWPGLGNRQSQAHLAVALKRFGDEETARDIMRSIKERAVHHEELGMFWRDTEVSWWWYRAPIETQAMMIEAFDEVMGDAEAVEGCKAWLLKQKQTQDWKTTKATADAVYALLLRGSNALASDALVEVALADRMIEPENVEAGTGFYEKRFVGPEIRPEMGRVTVKKVDDGAAWGSVHWQYLEDIEKIRPHEGTPLKLEKALFLKENTATGPVLKPAAGPVAVGDELVVRVVLRTDRDMEYIHMKDHRGSGTEPVNVLSRYKHQDGLYYYESTRDTATHFFIDYLPKGTYVFEYSVRVQHRGRYSTGMAHMECMYAPEFNSHSQSIVLDVR